MKERNVEVAIIGAGTAGLSAYREASKQTQNIVLIEGGAYGTTCARVGCMPSKLLIAAAEAAHAAKNAHRFGVKVDDVSINGKEVMARVKSERDRFVGFVLESITAMNPSHLMRGEARFISPLTLQIDGKELIKARSIVIAAGSQPIIPPFLKNLEDRILLNDNLFDMDDLPGSIAVFGTGVIGLELGQALHRLGVKVSIFGRRGRVSPLTDPICAEYAIKCFMEELELTPAARIIDVSHNENQYLVQFSSDDGPERAESFEHILSAVGRKPNLKELAIENSGLDLDASGIPIFDPYTMQCGDQPVFMAGDVNNDRPLLHEAADEGRIAGHGAVDYPDVTAGLRRTPMAIIFTDPQIAMVGMRHSELKEGTFQVGEVSFENQGRSRVLLKNKGVLRVYGAIGSGKFLGAEMIGPAVEHIGHLLAWAKQQDLTVSTMLEMPFYHPVIEEGVRTALRDLNKKLRMGPAPVKGCLDCGPGA